MPPRRRRHVIELGLILLLNDILQFGMRNIPPMTLCFILGQTFLYMGVINAPWTREEVCVSGSSVILDGEWNRLLLFAFEHGDDMHLYYNMASFLLKGRYLENRYGSQNFGFIILFLTLATSTMYVLLAALLWTFTDDEAYMKSCAIGFSGVVFALKVLTFYEEPNLKTVLIGIQLPGKYAAWVELILIHIVPNSSFLGHLAGILAGGIYCYTNLGKYYDTFLHCLTGTPVIHQDEENSSEKSHRHRSRSPNREPRCKSKKKCIKS